MIVARKGRLPSALTKRTIVRRFGTVWHCGVFSWQTRVVPVVGPVEDERVGGLVGGDVPAEALDALEGVGAVAPAVVHEGVAEVGDEPRLQPRGIGLRRRGAVAARDAVAKGDVDVGPVVADGRREPDAHGLAASGTWTVGSAPARKNGGRDRTRHRVRARGHVGDRGRAAAHARPRRSCRRSRPRRRGPAWSPGSMAPFAFSS